MSRATMRDLVSHESSLPSEADLQPHKTCCGKQLKRVSEKWNATCLKQGAVLGTPPTRKEER